jgi:hypothetical protein
MQPMLCALSQKLAGEISKFNGAISLKKEAVPVRGSVAALKPL